MKENIILMLRDNKSVLLHDVMSTFRFTLMLTYYLLPLFKPFLGLWKYEKKQQQHSLGIYDFSLAKLCDYS
jgi:antibiotic biosynthesis monooxygenase (ABM) superfamily enzyme